MIAVMANIFSFAEESRNAKSGLNSKLLRALKNDYNTFFTFDFNLQLIGSPRYVESKLASLNDGQVTESLKTSEFMASTLIQSQKEVTASRHQSFWKTSDLREIYSINAIMPNRLNDKNSCYAFADNSLLFLANSDKEIAGSQLIQI
jgi:hypothetical protein